MIFAIVSIFVLFLCGCANEEAVTNGETQTTGITTEKSSYQTIYDVVNEQANIPEFKNVGYFKEGLAYARKERSEDYGYIDESGNVVIEFKYKSVGNFSEGVAVVSEDGEKYGYIDREGNWVIEPILDFAVEFHDGKATVQVGITYYEIDKEGNVLREIKNN